MRSNMATLKARFRMANTAAEQSSSGTGDMGAAGRGDTSTGSRCRALKFTPSGERLQGGWVLVRDKRGQRGSKRTNWLLIKHRDEFARDAGADETVAEDHSVASRRTTASIAVGRGHAPTSFMLVDDTAVPDAAGTATGWIRLRRVAPRYPSPPRGGHRRCGRRQDIRCCSTLFRRNYALLSSGHLHVAAGPRDQILQSARDEWTRLRQNELAPASIADQQKIGWQNREKWDFCEEK